MSAALIAPAGTGKTALLRRLRDGLPDACYHVHYVKVTGLSKRDMCREIAVACGAQPAGSYPMLVRRLQERFEATSHEEGRRPVLLLDESHELRPDVLGMLRILTNFDMDSRLVLSLILAGQTPLRALLAHDEHEAMACVAASSTTPSSVCSRATSSHSTSRTAARSPEPHAPRSTTAPSTRSSRSAAAT
jgi:general secretion pathway protein A